MISRNNFEKHLFNEKQNWGEKMLWLRNHPLARSDGNFAKTWQNTTILCANKLYFVRMSWQIVNNCSLLVNVVGFLEDGKLKNRYRKFKNQIKTKKSIKKLKRCHLASNSAIVQYRETVSISDKIKQRFKTKRQKYEYYWKKIWKSELRSKDWKTSWASSFIFLK